MGCNTGKNDEATANTKMQSIQVSTQPTQNYTVKLPSNATTGYSWFIKSYDSNWLTLQSHQYVAPQTNRVGAGGYEIWVFAPTHAFKAPHAIPVTFVYARSWELTSGTAKIFKRKPLILLRSSFCHAAV